MISYVLSAESQGLLDPEIDMGKNIHYLSAARSARALNRFLWRISGSFRASLVLSGSHSKLSGHQQSASKHFILHHMLFSRQCRVLLLAP